MKKPIIHIITTSRADYGLLKPLIDCMALNTVFESRVIVTGSHLSEFYGLTVNKIEDDGVVIYSKIPVLANNDTEYGVCKTVSNVVERFGKFFSQENPDLIFLLGDRYELVGIATAALINKIPVAHIHGGEQTTGVIDDAIRNAVTKMASIHFASIKEYASRIIQMGEAPDTVHVVGAIGLDNILKNDIMGIDELSSFTGIDFNNNVALVTYHPVTYDSFDAAANQMEEVCQALLESDLYCLITMPNADTAGSQVIRVIDEYIAKYPGKYKFIKNLGQKAYLSALKYAKIMVGNSSSGIIESASFKIPVVNIGDRQGGRIKPDNVIDCLCCKSEIFAAIEKGLSHQFANSLKSLVNPYGDGHTAPKIVSILQSVDLFDRQSLLKKKFYDLKTFV